MLHCNMSKKKKEERGSMCVSVLVQESYGIEQSENEGVSSGKHGPRF